MPDTINTPTAAIAPISAATLIRAGESVMTCRELALLAVANAAPGLSVKDYADMLRVPKPVITRCADNLIERGWMHRERDLRDGRCVRLFVRAAGKHLLVEG